MPTTAPAGAPGVQIPAIKVNGADLTVEQLDDLIDLRVALSVNAAAMTQLRFDDATFKLLDADTFAIGGKLAVSLPTSANKVVSTFAGEIVSVGVDQGHGGRHELVITAFDKAHVLSGHSTQKGYLNQTKANIVTAIAQSAGLQAKVDPTGAVEPYILQTGTDYAFLWEMARSLGFEWFVEDTTLVFRKRPKTAGVTLTWGEDLLRFQARYSAADAAVKGLTVRGWDPVTQKAITGEASAVLGTPAAQDLGSDAALASASHSKAKSAFGKDIVVGSAAVRTPAEATALAGALAKELIGDAVTARGETIGNPLVKPGTMVKVADMGSKLSGSYYVTDVEHVFGVGRPLVTRFTVAGHRRSGLADLGSGATATAGSVFGSTGVVLGVVSNTKDPDKQGRVKVKFPTLGDAVESGWARVSSPGAGHERGMQFLPEVNDEVVVAFDRGDLRQPVVIGGLWSTKNTTPSSAAVESDGSIAKRVIKTRAGHVIELSDGKNGTAKGSAERYVKVALADGVTKLHLGEDHIDLTADKGRAIKVNAGDTSFEITAAGDVSVKGVNVTLEAKGKLTIKAAQFEAKASAGAKIDGGPQFEATAAMVKVEGSGMTQIKGAMLKLN